MNDQMNQAQKMNQSQGVINPPFLSQPQPQMMMNKKPQISNRSRLGTSANSGGPSRGTAQSLMMIRNYGVWPPPQTPVEVMNFQNVMKQQGYGVSGVSKQSKPRNWIGKKGRDKRKPVMAGGRPSGGAAVGANVSGGPGGVGGVYRSGVGAAGGYKPPNLNELQNQNRIKARRFYQNKRNNRFAPYAPRNTTSFLIRAKKSGGIASLVSPCPVTPSVLPTPIFSPSTEVLGDTAKERWGVDGYGSMKGLIRLRSPGNEEESMKGLIRLRSPGNDEEQAQEDLEEEEGGGSSESDVEEHLEVERRLDQDLSRFEMVYPNQNNVLENRVNDQDSHIAQLEEENLMLKERLFLMDRELGDLRRRLQFLERQNPFVEMNEEVVDNVVSENESEEVAIENYEEECGENEFVKDVCMEEPPSVVADKLCEVRNIDAVDEAACMEAMAAQSHCEEHQSNKEDALSDKNIGDQ